MESSETVNSCLVVLLIGALKMLSSKAQISIITNKVLN